MLCCSKVCCASRRGTREGAINIGHGKQIENRGRKRAYAMACGLEVAVPAQVNHAQLRGDEAMSEKSRSG